VTLNVATPSLSRARAPWMAMPSSLTIVPAPSPSAIAAPCAFESCTMKVSFASPMPSGEIRT
jgi:hypothetical protein